MDLCIFFRCVQVRVSCYIQTCNRVLDELLMDSQRLVVKPLLCCAGCILQVIVVLKDEPSPCLRSRALWRLSSRTSLYFAASILSSVLSSPPVPAAYKGAILLWPALPGLL